MTAVTLTGSAVYRTARKEWRCTCAVPGGNNVRGRSLMCQGAIRPGDEYVESLGENGSYRSGVRYCMPCGVKAWGVHDDETPAAPSGRDGVGGVT